MTSFFAKENQAEDAISSLVVYDADYESSRGAKTTTHVAIKPHGRHLVAASLICVQ